MVSGAFGQVNWSGSFVIWSGSIGQVNWFGQLVSVAIGTDISV
jgi:hypothetical protein